MRSNNQPYYDDENLQPIEEYSVVDYTLPTTQDYNNPNTDKSVAIEDKSPRYTVEESSQYITSTAGPFVLDRDTVFEAINQIEGGEIVSIELVTDNPYASLYLELDDYKYKAPRGMTAAELLMKGRNEYSERHFYAEDRRPDGTYVIKYHPRKTDKYMDKIKVVVRNDIRSNSDFRGKALSYKSRGSLPTPNTVGFSGGSVLKVPELQGIPNSKEFLLEELLTKHTYDYDSNVPNDIVRTTPGTLLGVSHPYVGQAGAYTHTAFALASGARIVFGKPGVKISSTTGVGTPDSVAFPGTGFDNNHSEQQILLYASNAENETTALNENVMIELEGAKLSGQPFYLRVEDKIYYPGNIVGLDFYDAGTSRFQTQVGGGTHEHVQNTDGAILITVSPGLPFTPPSFDLGDSDAFNALGRVDYNAAKNSILVHEITINRRKLKSLN